MAKNIKTKTTIKDIKVLDKVQDISAHVKTAFIRSKESAEQTQSADHNSPSEYATDKVSEKAKETSKQAAHHLKNPHKKASENVNRAKENFQKARQHKHMSDAKNAVKKPSNTARQVADKSVKTVRQAEKSVKQSAKATGKTIKTGAKGTVKTAQKSVKTAEKGTKIAIKTSQQAAKAAAKTAQATAKAAKVAVQAARAAAKATAVAVKATIKAMIAFVKASIAAIKGLVAAIAAGGWVAVLIILIICMVGLLVGSIFGIFFSGEDSSADGRTMNTVITQINGEFTTKVDEIKISNTHDLLDMSGARTGWKDVLAVYAVKTTSDPDNPMEVATIDNAKVDILRSVFWDMNVLSHTIETKDIEEDVIGADGNPTGETETVSKTVLTIFVTRKTTDDMATHYGFNADQKKQLAELLKPEYNDMWNSLLYGISSSGDGTIVGVAASQIGNVGGQPYWSWYGFDGRVEWCATFVSWCANECGYIDAGLIPKFAACQSEGVAWFKDKGQWQDGSYTPKAGDIIFFDWDADGSANHVGIVEKAENGTVFTIEGNSSDACKRRTYTIGSSVILGYGIPLY